MPRHSPVMISLFPILPFFATVISKHMMDAERNVRPMNQSSRTGLPNCLKILSALSVIPPKSMPSIKREKTGFSCFLFSLSSFSLIFIIQKAARTITIPKASEREYEASLQDERAAYISIASAVGTTYLNIGDAIDSSLYNGSLVVLKENGKNSNRDISSYLTITVTNSSGDIITTISSDTQETYTITYTIDYNGFHDSISSKIVNRS